MAKFLVTGGAGFIGSHLVEHLLEKSQGVVVLDDLSTGKRTNLGPFQDHPGFVLIEGDVRRREDCLRAAEGVDYVLHQAALGSVPRSLEDPLTANAVNIGGHLNILLAARECGVKRVVYAASSSTYGDSRELPKVESRIGRPLSPYAVTKYTNELYGSVFYRAFGLETIGLRYFNVFGPRQDTESPYAAVIPIFVRELLRSRAPWIDGDGEQTRDFTYVDDVVQANLLACQAGPEAVGEIFNVAGGKRVSINQLYELIARLLGSDLRPRHRAPRKGDVRDSLADLTKARRCLGYVPRHDVRAGLEKAIGWYKSHLK